MKTYNKMTRSTRPPHGMTVADLRVALADIPDWASVQVTTYDAMDCPEEHDPRLDYSAGTLTIDVA
ncbi:hypothetical protein ABZ820_33650 [Streptomyces diacarni]|uniref:hypothetical protein n=1 Tax=Streptomyces diacarni TaxID=2800381 RepID=UPI0033EDC622